jgi:hypothetical protein
MPTAPENVGSLGSTGRDRRAARTKRLTHLRHPALSVSEGDCVAFALAARSQGAGSRYCKASSLGGRMQRRAFITLMVTLGITGGHGNPDKCYRQSFCTRSDHGFESFSRLLSRKISSQVSWANSLFDISSHKARSFPGSVALDPAHSFCLPPRFDKAGSRVA